MKKVIVGVKSWTNEQFGDPMNYYLCVEPVADEIEKWECPIRLMGYLNSLDEEMCKDLLVTPDKCNYEFDMSTVGNQAMFYMIEHGLGVDEYLQNLSRVQDGL
ncbi:hypothetical protein JHD48_10555 [Sulfurimonas sp. SAG-AH-194-I05]|nr:hypothetical protein [Sulfurimonas sp. SAG-AH-194-I05]MDF1876173.1 hypothetical protein [Sulfurimonas sp. SAG-AH-194-I05]